MASWQSAANAIRRSTIGIRTALRRPEEQGNEDQDELEGRSWLEYLHQWKLPKSVESGDSPLEGLPVNRAAYFEEGPKGNDK
jgi:hypothetical protein